MTDEPIAPWYRAYTSEYPVMTGPSGTSYGFNAGPEGVGMNMKKDYNAWLTYYYNRYTADQKLAGDTIVSYNDFCGVVRKAEASEYTADAAANAKEYAALQSYLSASRTAEAKEYAAALGLKGTEAQAFAKQYAAEQARYGKEYAANQARYGKVDAAQLDKEAKMFASELGLQGEQVKAFAQKYVSDNSLAGTKFSSAQSRAAQEYTARQDYAGKKRQAEAQEYGSRRSMEADVGSSMIQASSNITSEGFGQFNTSQRMGQQWAYLDNTPAGAFKRSVVAGVIFLMGLGILLIGMEVAGVPILEQLSQIAINAVGKTMGLIKAMERLGDSGNIDGIQRIVADGGASLTGAVSGLFATMLKKLTELFTTLFHWLQSLVSPHNVDAATSAATNAAHGSLGWMTTHITQPLREIFGGLL